MNREEIYQAIKFLSKSQGFYSHLLNQIEKSPEILDTLETQNFKDTIDMMMCLEDGLV